MEHRLADAARPSLAEDTSPTRKAAEWAWKQHWPKFRDARTEAEWHDAKASQDTSEKRIMIHDARKLPGLTIADLDQLTDEAGRPGPAPHWLVELLERRS
jgi:hypothetical protein